MQGELHRPGAGAWLLLQPPQLFSRTNKRIAIHADKCSQPLTLYDEYCTCASIRMHPHPQRQRQSI